MYHVRPPQCPYNTVMLLGSMRRTDRTRVTDLLNEHLLNGSHIEATFVTRSGSARETGLTETVSAAQGTDPDTAEAIT